MGEIAGGLVGMKTENEENKGRFADAWEWEKVIGKGKKGRGCQEASERTTGTLGRWYLWCLANNLFWGCGDGMEGAVGTLQPPAPQPP